MEAVIIGFGSIGIKHAKNLSSLGVQVMAVADTNEYVEPNPHLPYPVTSYIDPMKCLEREAKDRLVVISSPNMYHAEQAISALYNSAKGVFIEKPMAVTVPDAENIHELSTDLSIPVCVGFNWRYHDGFQKLMTTIIARPGAFHVVSIENVMSWPAVQKDRNNSHIWWDTGSIVFSSLPHAIDLSRYINGNAMNVGATIEIPDTAVKSNQSVTVKMDGELGPSYIINKWTNNSAGGRAAVLSWMNPGEFSTIDLINGNYSSSNRTMHLLIMQAFVRHLNEEAPLNAVSLPMSIDGLEVCRTIEAIERSWENQGYEEVVRE